MRLFHILLLILVVAIWGFNFVVIKIGLKEISPFIFCFARFFLASIPLVFFVKKPCAPLKTIILYGLVMFALQYSLLFVGMKMGLTAGLASLLLQTQVFFTILFAVIFLDEKPNMGQVIGALVSFSGVAMVGLNAGGTFTISGFLLVIAAAVSWSAGNLISKNIGKVNMLSLVVWGNFVAWPPLLLIALYTEGGDKILYSFQHLSWLSWVAIMYVVCLSTVFGFTVWSGLLSLYPVTSVAPFTLLVPIFGMLSSSLVLGETFEPWKICASLLVILGLCINVLTRNLVRGRTRRI